MATEESAVSRDGLFQEWRRKAYLRRLLLPQDFMENVTPCGQETMVCRKTTSDYVVMSDRVEKKTVRTGEAGKYSTDLSYRPTEFKDQTLRIFADKRQVQCDKCSGDRRVSCPTSTMCWQCGGKGRRKETKRGTREVTVPARTVTTGSGRFETETRIPARTSTREYQYKEWVRCGKCKGSGQVTCSKCDGTGWVTCNRCSGVGFLVSGNLITREFRHSQEVEYQLTGMDTDQFKNGLEGRHFNSMVGDLVSSEFQTPSNQETVLERKSVHSYDVLSRQYSYGEKQFHLNLITSNDEVKCLASGLPFSGLRVAAASIVASGAVAGAIAVLMALA